MSEIRDLARKLKKFLPIAFPVYVRTCKMPLDNDRFNLGDCQLLSKNGKKHFLIRINSDNELCGWARELVLLHEYAHARCWSLLDVHKEGSIKDHHPSWGVSYAECWEVYVTDEHELKERSLATDGN